MLDSTAWVAGTVVVVSRANSNASRSELGDEAMNALLIFAMVLGAFFIVGNLVSRFWPRRESYSDLTESYSDSGDDSWGDSDSDGASFDSASGDSDDASGGDSDT